MCLLKYLIHILVSFVCFFRIVFIDFYKLSMGFIKRTLFIGSNLHFHNLSFCLIFFTRIHLHIVQNIMFSKLKPLLLISTIRKLSKQKTSNSLSIKLTAYHLTQVSTVTIKSPYVSTYVYQNLSVRHVRGQIPKSTYQASHLLPSDFLNNFFWARSYLYRMKNC